MTQKEYSRKPQCWKPDLNYWAIARNSNQRGNRMESTASGVREKTSLGRNRATSGERRYPTNLPLGAPTDHRIDSNKQTELLQCQSIEVMLTNTCSIISKLDQLRKRILRRVIDAIATSFRNLDRMVSIFSSDRLNHRDAKVLMYNITWLNSIMWDVPPEFGSEMVGMRLCENEA